MTWMRATFGDDTLIERLRREAVVQAEDFATLTERLEAAENELEDLRAVRDALTPPELPRAPGAGARRDLRPGLRRAGQRRLLPGGRGAAGVHRARRRRRRGPWPAGRAAGGVRADGVRRDRPLLRRPLPPAELGEHRADRACRHRQRVRDRRLRDVSPATSSSCAGPTPAIPPRSRWTTARSWSRRPRERRSGSARTPAASRARDDRTAAGACVLYTDGLTEARHGGQLFGLGGRERRARRPGQAVADRGDRRPARTRRRVRPRHPDRRHLPARRAHHLTAWVRGSASADPASGSHGISTCRRVPRPGGLSSESVPSSAATRSPRPRRPEP